jgi:O-antigen/teichoic acid export membrane protein
MSVATLAAAQFGLHEELVQASWGLTGSAALILLFWLLRGISYLKLAAGPSASAACLYVACLLLGLEVLHARRLLCPATTLLLMAAASTAAAAVLLGRLRLPAAREKGESAAPVGVREVWCEHWGYGRWALAAALASWAPSNICYVLTGGLLGIAYAGALRALLNLVMPVIQTAAALSRLCLPYLSGIAGREGMLATRTPVSRMIWLLAGGASGYWVLVSVFHRSLFEWLYGGRFAEFSHLAPWATLGGVFWTASFCYGLGLRAIQSPFSDLLVQSAAGGVSLLLGVPLIWSLGVSGAVGTLMLSTLAAVAVSTVVFRQKLLRAAAAPG